MWWNDPPQNDDDVDAARELGLFKLSKESPNTRRKKKQLNIFLEEYGVDKERQENIKLALELLIENDRLLHALLNVVKTPSPSPPKFNYQQKRQTAPSFDDSPSKRQNLGCNMCGNTNTNLFKCAGNCDPTLYCSEKCQIMDWNRHSEFCN